ncbi:S-layer homology domain-containing protein [Sporosarcina sp. 179-K 3D1 HS]|uniref:S-layer homology domain-containing protein n=1 Tax=Sporosarcina sp. 179-K 3D1 HS TaxID=3232169 RepID=UPI0039A1C8C8
MEKLKKISTLLTCSTLSFVMLASTANASTPVDEHSQKVHIQIAAKDLEFSKNDLIQKFRALFPNQFTFLSDRDFQMSGGHMYPDDDTVRYSLHFSKAINGKQVHGSVGFVGEALEVEYFSYQPPNVADALFPAKVSKDEAKKIAIDFMKSIPSEEEYRFETDAYHYYPHRILTEPIRYSFTFARTKDQVAIADQQLMVTVLGNGEVVEFYRNQIRKGPVTFDDMTQAMNEKNVLQKIKDNLSVDLYYFINMDYQTGERNVDLVYQPRTRNIHALSGKWQTANGYSTELPKKTEIKKIVNEPLPPRQEGMTKEEARKLAEQILASQSDKVKLTIQSIEDMKNYNGQEVYSIHYMYMYKNGGYGSNLEINKQTGEITQHHNMSDQMLEEVGEEPDKGKPISHEEALTSAIDYLKEWTPSYLHNYAYPLEEANFDERSGVYYFSFPRIVNGIAVMGDQISVTIGPKGTLNSLSVNYTEEENWPSVDQVISEKEALAIFKDALDVKLNYTKKEETQHYDLVYAPVFQDQPFSSLNANTGKWNSLPGSANSIVVKHPWAEEELNYLLNAKILQVKDEKNFNGDASATKGEALKVIVNSLTYFYADRYGSPENQNQTFENITPEHPMYQVVEHAVRMGLIQSDQKRFDVDKPVTREELAVWYIRVLGLEQAAKHSNIYKLDIADADQVGAGYEGYVALAHSLGLLRAEKGYFKPDQEVSYAELAVTVIRLAHEMSEKRYAW